VDGTHFAGDKIGPPEGMLFTTRKTIPCLKQLGVSERKIHTITVDNPKRFFGRSSAQPITEIRRSREVFSIRWPSSRTITRAILKGTREGRFGRSH
jgi:hypothetical protein